MGPEADFPKLPDVAASPNAPWFLLRTSIGSSQVLASSFTPDRSPSQVAVPLPSQYGLVEPTFIRVEIRRRDAPPGELIRYGAVDQSKKLKEIQDKAPDRDVVLDMSTAHYTMLAMRLIAIPMSTSALLASTAQRPRRLPSRRCAVSCTTACIGQSNGRALLGLRLGVRFGSMSAVRTGGQLLPFHLYGPNTDRQDVTGIASPE